MRVVALLVLVWLIVGAIAAFQRGYFTQAAQLCQRRDYRADRARRTTQLRGCQSQGDGLQRAATQLITPTAQIQPI